MSSTASYQDYLWTEQGGTAGEFQSFCLTYISDAQLSEVLSQLPVLEVLGELRFRELLEISYTGWDADQLLVGCFQRESCTVLFEVNGFVGITGPLMVPLSEGRRIVSHHYSDGNASGSVNIYEDMRLAATFTPGSGVATLWASDPDSLIPMMVDVGFTPATTVDHSRSAHERAAAFALMERLTEVHLSPRTITDASFRVVRVQMP